MKRILMVAMAALLLGACNKKLGDGTTDGTSPQDMKVTIDPTITRATEVDFEADDAIGVTITTAEETYVANRKFIYGADSRFSAEEALLWYEDINAPSTLFAYYPHAAEAPVEFTVAADQTGDGYGASDLMTAYKDNVYPTKNAISMTFRHKMARLILTVDNKLIYVPNSEITSRSRVTAITTMLKMLVFFFMISVPP